MTTQISETVDRGEPATLGAVARAMYGRGAEPEEVVKAIYGVALPREAALVLRDFVSGEKALAATWRARPWGLMVPPEYGGLIDDAAEAEEEARLFRGAPELVLVATSEYRTDAHDARWFAYHLGELRAGRSTVYGAPRVPASLDAAWTAAGASLIDAFRQEIMAAQQLAVRAARAGEYSAMTDFYELRETLDQLAAIEAELAR